MVYMRCPGQLYGSLLELEPSKKGPKKLLSDSKLEGTLALFAVCFNVVSIVFVYVTAEGLCHHWLILNSFKINQRYSLHLLL